jgi:hypothetical protein
MVGAAMALVLLTGWAFSRSSTDAVEPVEPPALSAPSVGPASTAAAAASGLPRLPPERRNAPGARRERSPDEVEKVRELRRKYEEQRSK